MKEGNQVLLLIYFNQKLIYKQEFPYYNRIHETEHSCN